MPRLLLPGAPALLALTLAACTPKSPADPLAEAGIDPAVTAALANSTPRAVRRPREPPAFAIPDAPGAMPAGAPSTVLGEPAATGGAVDAVVMGR